MKILLNGAEPDEAKLWVVLLHGRGAGAEDILGLSMEFEPDPDLCWMAPQAMNNSWYPGRFQDRRRTNEPYLTVSLETVKGLIEKFPPERLILAGFSQGACLVSDLLTREPRRYAGAWIFSGGFIGTEEETPKVEGDLGGTPVMICGSHNDPHIPLPRMQHTAQILSELGAEVSTIFYPGSSHTITTDEVAMARSILATLSGSQQPD